jgi:putative drug exporter of the RND superfamily
LFDTLIVRSFMTPSIAALLGRWFWWPQKVRPRPASYLLRPYAPRPVVRALLLGQRGASGGFSVQDGAALQGDATHDAVTQPLDLVGNGQHRRVQVPDRFADAHRRLGAHDDGT